MKSKVNLSKNLFNFTDDEQYKIDNSMHTLDELRVSPYFPYDQISKNSKLYKEFIANKNRFVKKTSWGEVEIANRLLTQHHLEVFSYVMAFQRKNKRLKKSGRIAIYFSLDEVGKELYTSKTRGSGTIAHLEEKLKEIEEVVIRRKMNNGNKDSYSIISETLYSEKEKMWCMVLSEKYSKIFMNNITIGFPARIKEISSITGRGSGLIKSIINHATTVNTQEGKWQKISFTKLLEGLPYDISTTRKIRDTKKIIEDNKNTLSGFGILYDKESGIFEFGPTHGINFFNPALPLEGK